MCAFFYCSLHSVLSSMLHIYVAHMNTPALKKAFHSSEGALLVHLGNTVIRSWSGFACGP